VLSFVLSLSVIRRVTAVGPEVGGIAGTQWVSPPNLPFSKQGEVQKKFLYSNDQTESRHLWRWVTGASEYRPALIVAGLTATVCQSKSFELGTICSVHSVK
jgi:hypothetical protein